MNLTGISDWSYPSIKPGVFNSISFEYLKQVYEYFTNQEPLFRKIMDHLMETIFHGGFKLLWGRTMLRYLPPVIQQKLYKFFQEALEHKFMFGFVAIGVAQEETTKLLYPMIPPFGLGQYYYGLSEKNSNEVIMTYHPRSSFTEMMSQNVSTINKKIRVFVWTGHTPSLVSANLICSRISHLYKKFLDLEQFRRNRNFADFGLSHPTLIISKANQQPDPFGPDNIIRYGANDPNIPINPALFGEQMSQKYYRATIAEQALQDYETAKFNAQGGNSIDVAKTTSVNNPTAHYQVLTQPHVGNRLRLVEGERVEHQVEQKSNPKYEEEYENYIREIYELFSVPKPTETVSRRFKDDVQVTEQQFRAAIQTYRNDIIRLWTFVYDNFLKAEDESMLDKMIDSIHYMRKKPKTEQVLTDYDSYIQSFSDVKKSYDEEGLLTTFVFNETYGYKGTLTLDVIEKARSGKYITVEEAVTLGRLVLQLPLDDSSTKEVLEERKTFEKTREEVLIAGIQKGGENKKKESSEEPISKSQKKTDESSEKPVSNKSE